MNAAFGNGLDAATLTGPSTSWWSISQCPQGGYRLLWRFQAA
jgi:hypothetical protein